MCKKVVLALLIGLMLMVSANSVWSDTYIDDSTNSIIVPMGHAVEVIDYKSYSQVKYTGDLWWTTTGSSTYYKTITCQNGYDYTTSTSYTDPVFHPTDEYGNGYYTRKKIVTYHYTTY